MSDRKPLAIQIFPIPYDRKHDDRYLTVMDLDVVAEAIGGRVRVSYHNHMDPGAIAGNHYHHVKREAFRAVRGRLKVTLQKPGNPEVLTVHLGSNPDVPEEFVWMVVPAGYAHAVENVTASPAVLEVFATNPPREAGDDFPFVVGSA